jgi:hypothetical protein
MLQGIKLYTFRNAINANWYRTLTRITYPDGTLCESNSGSATLENSWPCSQQPHHRILSWDIRAVHGQVFNFFKTDFNGILPSMTRSSKWSLPLVFYNNSAHRSRISNACYVHDQSHAPRPDNTSTYEGFAVLNSGGWDIISYRQPKFRSNMPPPSSGSKNKPSARDQHKADLLTTCIMMVPCLTYLSTVKMEATCPSDVDWLSTAGRYITCNEVP